MSNPKKCAACKGTGKVEGVVAAFEEPCGACKGTGKIQTKRYAQYQREKVREMLGHREQQEETPQWAAHGKEHEPRAIGAYEWRYELDIEHNVFLVSNKYDWLAGSPDMLHKPKFDDGLEIKCRALYKNYKKYRDLAEKHEGTAKACPPENRHQVQGFNMLTGFNRWGYVNYYIGSNLEGGIAQKLHRVWIPRDNTLIAQMEERAKRFIEECYKEAGLL
jgi:hypothetical protein